MATTAQILANRVNATLSTGPVTAEGKDRASFNAMTHGATSARRILPGENQEEFDTLLAAITEHYRPQNNHERELIERIADAEWRKRRIYRIENAFFAARIVELTQANPDLAGNPEAALAQLFIQPEEMKKASLLLRYIGAAERACRKALAEFREARENHAEPVESPTPVPSPQPAPPRQTTTRAERRALELARRKAEKKARRNGNGFVSQIPIAA